VASAGRLRKCGIGPSAIRKLPLPPWNSSATLDLEADLLGARFDPYGGGWVANQRDSAKTSTPAHSIQNSVLARRALRPRCCSHRVIETIPTPLPKLRSCVCRWSGISHSFK